MESQPGRDTTTWSFFQVATRQMDSVCGHLMKYNMKAPDDERNRT